VELAYLERCWHVFDLFVEYLLNPLPTRGNSMIRSIKCKTVAEDQSDIRYEVFRVAVPRISRVGVWLVGVGRGEFPIDSREVHWVLDNRWIMGDSKSNRIDGAKEGSGILQLLQIAYSRLTEAELCDAERH